MPDNVSGHRIQPSACQPTLKAERTAGPLFMLFR
jgi:hypothetical protein